MAWCTSAKHSLQLSAALFARTFRHDFTGLQAAERNPVRHLRMQQWTSCLNHQSAAHCFVGFGTCASPITSCDRTQHCPSRGFLSSITMRSGCPAPRQPQGSPRRCSGRRTTRISCPPVRRLEAAHTPTSQKALIHCLASPGTPAGCSSRCCRHWLLRSPFGDVCNSGGTTGIPWPVARVISLPACGPSIPACRPS